MEITPLLLSRFISSKICHDLANGLNCLIFAIDSISEPTNTEDNDEYIKNLQHTSQILVDQVKFFRACFGQSLPLEYGSPLKTIITYINNYLALFDNFQIVWTDSIENQFAKETNQDILKMIMNLILSCKKTLPFGGKIRIESTILEDGSLGIVASGISSKISLDADQELALKGRIPDQKITSENIELVFLQQLVQTLKGDIEIHMQEGKAIHLAVCIPR